MLRHNTPIEDHLRTWGLLVKREDLSCPPPGPPFSKTRGVYAHIAKRPEKVIGVLDTYHSQGGHAVAAACNLLGKKCVNYYPEYKYEPGHRAPQQCSRELGANLFGLPAGRSAVLYHRAKAHLATYYENHYMMPNALKLIEMVDETAKEVLTTLEDYRKVDDLLKRPILISVSSGTIAAGVIKGYAEYCSKNKNEFPSFLLHMGYSRSRFALLKYIQQKHGVEGIPLAKINLIDEYYSYKDTSKHISKPIPDWSCNPYYDLKAFHWWITDGRGVYREAFMWNIG